SVLAKDVFPDPESHQEMFKWEIEGVSTIDDKGKDSPTMTIRGIKWYIRVRTETSERTQNETNFSVYIYCKEKNNLDVWYADVLSNIRLVNRRDKEKDKHEKFSYRFTHSLTNSGYASFIKMSDLLAPDQPEFIFFQGFISDNKIKIEASIAVIKIHGLSSVPTVHDFSLPSEQYTDGVLIVGGRKVHISKQMLAINSPVFDALFFRGFKEANQDEIELEEVDHDEFVELLNALYSPDKDITPTNCGLLLRLADRFQIKHAVLLKLTKVSEITSLKNQRDYVPISDTVKLMVTELQLKLTSK
ncbi:hypothetical protein PMAYCL1PPCAC_33069, partial [Pristionchus mayeri]